MDWLLRLNDPSRDKGDEKAFVIWINGSAENREAWTRACRTWEIMGAALPARVHHHKKMRPLSPASARMPVGRRPGLSLAVAAVAICLVAIFALPTLMVRQDADYLTATAETRKITLDDGSTVELGAASALSVDFSDRSRRVRLLSGEAFFDVVQDSGRPFIVQTDALEVTVVGTAFDVNVAPQSETVQLAHGTIDLSLATTGERMRLQAGDVVMLEKASGRLSKTTTDVDAIASWREHRLFVQDVPIAEVVAELRRYHPSWITLASSELGQRRVTGLYDLADPDRALDALVSPYGGKVHHVSPYLRVLALF